MNQKRKFTSKKSKKTGTTPNRVFKMKKTPKAAPGFRGFPKKPCFLFEKYGLQSIMAHKKAQKTQKTVKNKANLA